MRVLRHKWPQERTEQLKSLRPTHSAREIGDLLDISRNAVCGKARKLFFAGELERKVDAPEMQRRTATREKNAEAKKPAPPPEPEPCAPVKLIDLQPHHCRWPLWDANGAPDFLHCGRKTDRVYCAEHQRVAFASTPKLREEVGA